MGTEHRCLLCGQPISEPQPATIPTWEEAEAAFKDGTATPLQMFIYENEPAGEIAEEAFRTTLLQLISAIK